MYLLDVNLNQINKEKVINKKRTQKTIRKIIENIAIGKLLQSDINSLHISLNIFLGLSTIYTASYKGEIGTVIVGEMLGCAVWASSIRSEAIP